MHVSSKTTRVLPSFDALLWRMEAALLLPRCVRRGGRQRRARVPARRGFFAARKDGCARV